MTNPIKLSFKTEWFAVLLIILAFITGVFYYQNFPAQVPTHWNLQGEVNGYSGVFSASFMLPIMMLGIYLLFLLLPYLDPKKEQYIAFAGIYHKFKDLILVFLFIMYIMTGLNGLGYKVDVAFYVPILVGVLFALIGLLLKNVKTNWFMGIRTPWTLSSEAVWEKTHKLAGPVFVVAGVLMAATAFVSANLKIALFVLAIAVIVLTLPIYSYMLYTQEKKERERIEHK
ncbi:MAG: SdpI family protein [Patescibacteria group bacterium]